MLGRRCTATAIQTDEAAGKARNGQFWNAERSQMVTLYPISGYDGGRNKEKTCCRSQMDLSRCSWRERETGAHQEIIVGNFANRNEARD